MNETPSQEINPYNDWFMSRMIKTRRSPGITMMKACNDVYCVVVIVVHRCCRMIKTRRKAFQAWCYSIEDQPISLSRLSSATDSFMVGGP
jgi:hypothetical protein